MAIESLPDQKKGNNPKTITARLINFTFLKRLFNFESNSSAGADPARVHWVHVHPPCAGVHAQCSKHPECLGKSKVHSQYYKTEYRVHPGY